MERLEIKNALSEAVVDLTVKERIEEHEQINRNYSIRNTAKKRKVK